MPWVSVTEITRMHPVSRSTVFTYLRTHRVRNGVTLRRVQGPVASKQTYLDRQGAETFFRD